MSFEILFDEPDDKDDSLIEKHPPKRILELKEAENKEPVTLEKLQEKLDEAEIRRQQVGIVIKVSLKFVFIYTTQ